ncbi:unnamed protein product [Caenorhabditis bovis]|uniref:Uncharacterized protein n=1 Tax=Caenorhabditis bovis TaxID=2654633 RepID=A0A8S1F8H9_9PELO|nr:unnamed protein product [Caenorhabditis bovis]
MSANNAIFMLSQAQLMKVIAQQGARGPTRIPICVLCERSHWPSECNNMHSTVEERQTVQRRCRAPRTETCKNRRVFNLIATICASTDKIAKEYQTGMICSGPDDSGHPIRPGLKSLSIYCVQLERHLPCLWNAVVLISVESASTHKIPKE